MEEIQYLVPDKDAIMYSCLHQFFCEFYRMECFDIGGGGVELVEGVWVLGYK